MNLKPLYEEAHQFNYYNGTLLSDGKVEVWYLNRTRYADIYADVGGETPLPNPIELNNLGMQPVYVNPAFNYTIVVKDVYGNEIFSVDKYMQAEGEHTMTNVVVQPSETVGVSAWTEGEVQFYQPYLSGDLGKTYSGIDPIVVNNDENKISAETVSFGVQEPLFFVKDDEEGCIIGCSAQTEIPSSVSGKWEEAADTVETNSAQWAQDTTYSAGANIDITDQVISVTGLQPSGDYATMDDLESGLSGKMDRSETANFYPMEGNPSGFLTAETDWTDTITAASSYAYEQATAAIPAPQDLSYISGQVDSKLPTSAFSTVSGDFITALPADMATTGDIADLAESISETYQPKGDYLTTGDSAKFYTTANESGFITGVPDDLDINGLTADEINVTALVNPGDSEIYGVVITPNEITLTDRDGNSESIYATDISDWNGVVNTVSTNSASWAQGGVDSATVSAIASDYAESAISSVSGNYYPMNSNPSGYLTSIPVQLAVDELIAYTGITSDGRISAPTVDAKEAVVPGDSEFYGVSLSTNGVEITDNELNTETITYNSITGWNSTMDTVSSNSAAWAGIDSATVSAIASDYAESAASGKLDTTAFNSAEFYTTANPSGFITGVDLTPYQTTAGMTAYQPAGDYLTTADSAEFYTTANPSGFITGIPDPLTVNEIHADSIQITAEDTGAQILYGVWIGIGGISIFDTDGGYAGINPTTVNNWDSTYNTVSNNSASWTGGGAGGDVYVSGFEYTTGGDISGYSGSAFVGNDETFELSAGYGISLTTGANSLTISNTLTFDTGSI